jgi:hypothetical protein
MLAIELKLRDNLAILLDIISTNVKLDYFSLLPL